MKVTLVMVMSLDGRSTKGNTSGTAGWASPEDQKVFYELIGQHDCMVMGSNTYKAVRDLIKPSADKPRFILTRKPELFEEDARKPGLIFTAESPREIGAKAKEDGHQKLLLVGGAETNAHFFDDSLIDELYVTVEPQIFGSGLPFVAPLKKPVNLQLIDYKKLNDQGTLLLHYLVTNS